jgi:hypothetical protein
VKVGKNYFFEKIDHIRGITSDTPPLSGHILKERKVVSFWLLVEISKTIFLLRGNKAEHLK